MKYKTRLSYTVILWETQQMVLYVFSDFLRTFFENILWAVDFFLFAMVLKDVSSIIFNTSIV